MTFAEAGVQILVAGGRVETVFVMYRAKETSPYVGTDPDGIGAASTAMISNVSPLLTIYLSVLVLGESFTLADGIGTALLVGGVGYHTWRDLRRRPPPAPADEV